MGDPIGAAMVAIITVEYLVACLYFTANKNYPAAVMYLGFALGNIGPLWWIAKFGK